MMITTDPLLRNPALPIGLFDSGLGGLTVWRRLRQQLPYESLIYFADSARVPYGSHTPAEIRTWAAEIMSWLVARPVKMIVMACNTSSALALDALRPWCPVPILGVILPGARLAVQQGSRIGILATAATVASHAYEQAIQESGQELNRTVQCWEQSCPEFVPMIEGGNWRDPQLRLLAMDYLQPLLAKGMDTLVYGCTHYPLLDPLIKSLLPRHVRRLDPALALVTAISQELDFWGLRQTSLHSVSTQFFVSGDPDRFADRAVTWLGNVPEVARVQLPILQKSAWGD
ncbi:MAG: glutamate racemase [Cyanobacteriota bacterium]|nr:glutamate racemase [Cyanobacteriota bacterium]